MPKRIVRVASILAFTFAAVPAHGQATAEAEAVAVVRKLFDAMRQVDSTAARALFHAKARLISTTVRDGAPVVQIQETVNGFIQTVGRPRSEVWDERIFNEKVNVDGPLASVWTGYVFYRGTTLSHCRVDHFLLLREGGAWKILELSDTRRTEGCS